jgi:hypothetical protein
MYEWMEETANEEVGFLAWLHYEEKNKELGP